MRTKSCPLVGGQLLKRWPIILFAFYLGAVVFATAARSQPELSNAQVRFWERDAACETGHSPPFWNYGKPGSGHGGPRYEGGIAFAPSTWRWWGRKVGAYPRYRHAYDAPARLQMAAAQWGLDNVGTWGCVTKV